MLSLRYFARLGLNPTELDERPTLKKLSVICEAQLSCIPFENLSQHGVGEPVSLDIETIARKVLDHHRGGFCFELNGLLASFLSELGYKVVIVPAHVYHVDEYSKDATHIFLMVTDMEDKEETKYLVDVGFGEPAIHPLRYVFDSPQRTPEGMVSQFVKDGDYVILQWFDMHNDEFSPRFKFKAEDAAVDVPGPLLAEFSESLAKVHNPEGIFEKKLIVCLVTRSVKKTVAGSRLKITGPPRFDKEKTTQVVKDLGGVDCVRAVLQSDFGIPLEETEGLELDKSNAAPPEMWMV